MGREAARLNANYTFDHFVIGSSNRFAHAAALAVAETPAQSYNPLFLAGSTGLGKTHLLQAIAHYVLEEHAGLRVRYVTCEAFTNDFIDALQEKRLEQFKGRYRAYDVLLVDDIQFLAGKQRMQEEFFHTFNTLYESGSQIVLSSDRPPKDISPLEGRLRSRFEWGLIADIQPPDLETRVAILLKKAHRDGITIADRDVLTAIAQRIQTNIRELEGALTRVVAYASLNGVPITVDLVRDVLHDQFPEGARLVTVEEIQKVVADHFRLTIADLRSDRRTQNVVFPRQIAMYLCRDLTDLSLPEDRRQVRRPRPHDGALRPGPHRPAACARTARSTTSCRTSRRACAASEPARHAVDGGTWRDHPWTRGRGGERPTGWAGPPGSPRRRRRTAAGAPNPERPARVVPGSLPAAQRPSNLRVLRAARRSPNCSTAPTDDDEPL